MELSWQGGLYTRGAPASGVKVDESCVQEFKKMQMKQVYNFLIFRISDDKKYIVVCDAGGPNASYDEFRDKLIAAEKAGNCRYGVYDVKFQTKNDQVRQKLVFFQWCPDTCVTREKMLYSSSVKALRDKLKGVHKEIQANDEDDLNYCGILEKCMDRYNN